MEILELKYTITKIKNSKDGLTIGTQVTEERISEFKDQTVEITQSEQQRVKRLFKNEQILMGLKDYNRIFSICVIRVPGRKFFPNWKTFQSKTKQKKCNG